MLANSKYNIAAGNLWAILTLCQISIIAEEKCIDLYLIGTAQLGRLLWWVIIVESLGSKVMSVVVHAPFGANIQ